MAAFLLYVTTRQMATLVVAAKRSPLEGFCRLVTSLPWVMDLDDRSRVERYLLELDGVWLREHRRMKARILFCARQAAESTCESGHLGAGLARLCVSSQVRSNNVLISLMN
jgi:hypothetical protein